MSVESFPSFDGQVEVHQLLWTREVVGGSVLNVESSHLLCGDSGLSENLSIHGGEFGPLEIGAVDIEGILLSSGSGKEDLSRSLMIFPWFDVTGDIGADLNLLGDVSLDEGIGVGGLCGVVV